MLEDLRVAVDGQCVVSFWLDNILPNFIKIGATNAPQNLRRRYHHGAGHIECYWVVRPWLHVLVHAVGLRLCRLDVIALNNYGLRQVILGMRHDTVIHHPRRIV